MSHLKGLFKKKLDKNCLSLLTTSRDLRSSNYGMNILCFTVNVSPISLCDSQNSCVTNDHPSIGIFVTRTKNHRLLCLCCNYRQSATRWRHCSASHHGAAAPEPLKLDMLRTSSTLSHERTPLVCFIAWFLTPHSLSNCYYTADGMRFIYLIPFTTKSHDASVLQDGGGIDGRSEN